LGGKKREEGELKNFGRDKENAEEGFLKDKACDPTYKEV